ncbi:hypothetical protein KSD_27710 [Ktedonobacter sp. SOSP1-85]|uniref:ATP-binding response regulator n=1 Tax=Ktedonobacter sp. SOSP1-85 TaxID=2778367 RepID=UPI001915902B|nr:response regulator [Ktedonobacter sp. SOSP1-85]GHO75000.1 hypothetical protein KSD_27710 [Ktedonobacter sp. SOSP1-85]
MENDKHPLPWQDEDIENSFDFAHEQELTPEDLAIIKAFEEMDDSPWQQDSEPGLFTLPTLSSPIEDTLDDMLVIFVDEVEEDIARIRRALNQLEQQDGTSIDSARLVTVKRAAHKIRGSAGMVECSNLSTIAHYLEEISEYVLAGRVEPFLSLNALVRGAHALEVTLEGFIQQGNESTQPREELEALLNELHLLPAEREEEEFEESDQVTLARELMRQVKPMAPYEMKGNLPSGAIAEELTSASSSSMRVEQRRFDQLLQHSESLIGQRMPLEQAQRQVEGAMQELQAAQIRLQQLEPLLANALLPEKEAPATGEFLSSSSLIRRILQEKQSVKEHSIVPQRPKYIQPILRQFKQPGLTSQWRLDELNMERYDEKDMLLRSFREAVADVSVASTHVQNSVERYNQVIADCLNQVINVRNDLRLMRLTPLSVIMPRLGEALQWFTSAQVQFEVKGETLEVDQEVLTVLTEPLVYLLQTCVREVLAESEEAGTRREGEKYRVWLHASQEGSEMELEIGFSTALPGGVLTLIHEPVQRLNGKVTLERNAQGGVSFHLYLPTSRGSTHCLLLRCGGEKVVVPFSQVQRLGDSTREQLDLRFNLNDLLDMSLSSAPETGSAPLVSGQTLLVLPRWGTHREVGIAVDEVIGEAEFVIKPLPAHLRRPGLAGTAIDGHEHVLLVLELPELIKTYTTHQHELKEHEESPYVPQRAHSGQAQAPRILIADDSVSMRLSLRQTLTHAHYNVMEASDGLEALELLQVHVPDVLLLDIEMPNLNGYDLLNLMRLRPELSTVKTIMLTSRSSEKHMKHAMELGAFGYLTKPCPLELLLEKVQQALKKSVGTPTMNQEASASEGD